MLYKRDKTTRLYPRKIIKMQLHTPAELPGLLLCGNYGLYKQSFKKSYLYLIFSPNIEEGREGIDVEEATHKYCHEGSDNEGEVEYVLGEGEHGHADVGEDKVLRHEVEHVKELLRGLLLRQHNYFGSYIRPKLVIW